MVCPRCGADLVNGMCEHCGFPNNGGLNNSVPYEKNVEINLDKSSSGRYNGAVNQGNPNMNYGNPNNGYGPAGSQNYGNYNNPGMNSGYYGNPNNGYNQQPYQNYQAGNNFGNGGFRPSNPIANRNIALYIILSIVTCGIFGLVWMAMIVNDLNSATNDQESMSGGLVVLLSIITCGIFWWYTAYKSGEKVQAIHSMAGQPSDGSETIIYLLLSIFGLSIVTVALIQNELNKIATA